MNMNYSTATNIAKQHLSQKEFEAFNYFWTRKDMISLGHICLHDKAELVRVKEMINKAINENPNINKSELKRNLASKYGYTSENSVNTIIWEIEKNNGRKSKKIENEN